MVSFIFHHAQEARPGSRRVVPYLQHAARLGSRPTCAWAARARAAYRFMIGARAAYRFMKALHPRTARAAAAAGQDGRGAPHVGAAPVKREGWAARGRRTWTGRGVRGGQVAAAHPRHREGEVTLLPPPSSLPRSIQHQRLVRGIERARPLRVSIPGAPAAIWPLTPRVDTPHSLSRR